MKLIYKIIQFHFRTQYYQPIPGNKQLFHIPHGVKKRFHMVVLGSRSDDASCSGGTYTHKVGSTSKELKHRVIIKYFSMYGKFLYMILCNDNIPLCLKMQSFIPS